MVLGDKSASEILATSVLSTALLTSESGKSPMFGLIQLFKQLFQSPKVAFAIGLRLRVGRGSATSLLVRGNVTLWASFTTFSKCSTVSAPLSAMISRAAVYYLAEKHAVQRFKACL